MTQPSAPDVLDPAALARGLRTTRFRHGLHHLAVTGSTSILALEAAANGATEGVWIADEQTAGRGRGGHAWLSVPGDGLYVSALVMPELAADRALWLSLATGLAAQAAIAEVAGLYADIRWPNDLLLGGRKCGGVLVESTLTPPSAMTRSLVHPGGTARLRYAVIGIGINVGHRGFPPELATLATSLRLKGWAEARRQPLLLALLRHLDRELNALEEEAALEPDKEPGASSPARPGLLARFTQASGWACGRRVEVPEQGGYTGQTAGLDERGFLLVESDDGVRRTVLTGGVREV